MILSSSQTLPTPLFPGVYVAFKKRIYKFEESNNYIWSWMHGQRSPTGNVGSASCIPGVCVPNNRPVNGRAGRIFPLRVIISVVLFPFKRKFLWFPIIAIKAASLNTHIFILPVCMLFFKFCVNWVMYHVPSSVWLFPLKCEEGMHPDPFLEALRGPSQLQGQGPVCFITAISWITCGFRRRWTWGTYAHRCFQWR